MVECNKHLERLKRTPIEWTLVVIELGATGWTYYVYVFLICIQTSHNLVEYTILLSTFHFLAFMAFWCYLKALLTPRMPIPKEFYVDSKTYAKIEIDANLQQQTRERLGIKTISTHRGSGKMLNYCHQCGNIKPDRCHHCSRCKVCVLRMDHHCPWLNRCVGFHNHKYFILFIHYIFVYCVFVLITSVGFLHRIWRRDWVGKGADDLELNGTLPHAKEAFTQHNSTYLRNDTIGLVKSIETQANQAPLSTVVALSATVSSSFAATTSTSTALAVSEGTKASLIAGTGLSPAFLHVSFLILFYTAAIISLTPLLQMHAELMANNVTTLEQFKPAGLPGGTLSEKTFDLGSVSANHREIMGPQLWLWPFPVFTSQGDGVHFNVCETE